METKFSWEWVSKINICLNWKCARVKEFLYDKIFGSIFRESNIPFQNIFRRTFFQIC